MTSGVPFSESEVKRLCYLYIDQNKTVPEIVKMLNIEFWDGVKVRTQRTIESKLFSMKITKGYRSNVKGKVFRGMTAKIVDLKKRGFSYVEVSDKLGVPVGTVKSTISQIKSTDKKQKLQQQLVAENNQTLAQMETQDELLRRIDALEKCLIKERATNQLIVDTIKTSTRALKPAQVPNIIIHRGMHKPETAMLELGDLHCGEKIVKEEVANVTEFNFDLFMERTDILCAGILECVDIQRSKIPIDTIDINVNGDIVTGEDIYLGQNRNIDLPLVKQTMEGANVLTTRLIQPLSKFFKKVRIRAVWGNHGRPSRPGQFHPKTNFDYIAYQFMFEQLRAQKNVEFYIAECPLMLFRLPEAPDWLHLLSHGDEVRGSMGLPYYGLERDHGRYVQLFGQAINYWHLGHHHSRASIDIPYGERIVNGSYVGGSDLSVFKMKTKSQPKQLLFGFNNSRGITWRYDIKLAPMEKLVADSNMIYTPTYNENNLLSNKGRKK